MRSAEAADPSTCRHDSSGEDPARRSWSGAIAGVAAVAASAAAVAAGPALPSVLAGMNLGNHNETLLTPTPVRRRVARSAAVAVVVGTLSVGGVVAGFSTSPRFGVDTYDASRGGIELAVPGNYTSSSGGGGTG